MNHILCYCLWWFTKAVIYHAIVYGGIWSLFSCSFFNMPVCTAMYCHACGCHYLSGPIQGVRILREMAKQDACLYWVVNKASCLPNDVFLKGTKLHFKSPTAERRHASCVGGWRGSNPRRPAPMEQGMPALTSRLLRALYFYPSYPFIGFFVLIHITEFWFFSVRLVLMERQSN